ncbi:MAG: hypothetical protein HKP08_08450, partial [Flavobacteriaceae bacterium]|nr:hypothetical protein [Flavobacteriaceae bacterium]
FFCLLMCTPLLRGQKENQFYKYKELEIFLDGWEIHRQYNHDSFLKAIHTPYTQFEDTTSAIYEEFGYDIYYYIFDNGFVEFRDGTITGMVLHNNSLAVDGIRVGDSIDKVASHYSKCNYSDQMITIWDGDFPLVFSYNSDQKITMISYSVRL